LSETDGDITQGTLLGGRVSYAQFRRGYRTGLEPVLLAASVPAAPGDHVLEAGAGAGAALLCLAARVPDLHGVGVEQDAALAALARKNAAANGADGVAILCADVLHWQQPGTFDHAMANPPWHDEAGTPSPDSGRAAAKRATPGLLGAWAAALARHVKPRGSVSLILPASSLAAGMAALCAADCREISLLPLWPRAGAAAKLMILRGLRAGRGPCALLPGLVLHEGEGFSAAADAVLRKGEALT
jgi:tRNA1Val (adenine37-N6)-methyltransferase